MRAAFQWHSWTGESLFSLRLPARCVLACFAVHCCVSKLYWHSPRLLALPHHLCCSPSLPVPLSPDWLTRIFNLSVYLSLLCLKQHWYGLRARRGLVVVVVVGRGVAMVIGDWGILRWAAVAMETHNACQPRLMGGRGRWGAMIQRAAFDDSAE